MDELAKVLPIEAVMERRRPGAKAPPRPVFAEPTSLAIRLDPEDNIYGLPIRGHCVFGHPGVELEGHSIEQLFAERSRAVLRGMLDRFRPGEPFRWHLRCGELLWVSREDRTETPVRVSVARGDEAGLVIFLRDARDEFRSSMLSSSESELGGTSDYEQALSAAAGFAARTLADCAVLEVPAAGDKAGDVVAAATREAELAVVRELERQWSHRELSALSRRTIADGTPLLVSGEACRVLAGAASLRPSSLMVVPLSTAGGKPIASKTYISTRPNRVYGAADLALALELGRQAARAIEQMRQLRNLQQLAARRQQMMHAVSHELRNTLGAVTLWTELVAQKPPFSEEPDRTKALTSATTRMARLVADLRDADAIDSGQFKVSPGQGVSPAAVVSSAVVAAQAIAPNRPIEVAAAPGLPGVRADEQRIIQVLTNLIGNAIKFSPPDAVITVGARTDADGEVLFFVRDEGIGIAEADQPHIFERGWQANPKDGRGSGLGLAISRAIVEAHGGALWVASRPGQGSTFIFTLGTSSAGVITKA